MNEIQKFVNEEFGTIRTATINNEPWFAAKDICDILGVINTTMSLKNLEYDEVTKLNLGGLEGETNFVSESGFYTLVLRSRKEIAKPFRLWVTREVLPQIRQTGGYIPIDENDSEKEIMAKALLIANKTISELQQFYDDLMNTEGLMQINTVAKELGIGEYTLFAYLRGKKVFFYDKDKVNVPYERFRKEGKFVVKETPCHDGNMRAVTYATKKGLEYIRKILRKDGYYNTEVTV